MSDDDCVNGCRCAQVLYGESADLGICKALTQA